MHHYSIFTTEHFAKTFPERVADVLKISLPRLALEHEFLMDAILLVAVVHMSCTEPTHERSLPVYLYRHQALRSLRQAVASISDDTSGPVLCASALLATASFAADRIACQSGLWMANWLALVLGQRNFRGDRAGSDKPDPFGALAAHRADDAMPAQTNLYGAFADIPGPGVAPTDVQRALARMNDTDLEWKHRDALNSVARDLGRLVAVLAQPYEEGWLERQVKSWAWDMIPLEYPELVRRGQPQALVILAYYLAVFKLLPDSWTYQGVVTHDMGEICNMIEPEWSEYIAVPKLAAQMDDKTALARMLVSTLPVLAA